MVSIRVPLVLVTILFLINVSEEKLDLTVITSAKSNTDVFQRFLRSSKVYNLDVKIIDDEESVTCEMEDGYCRRDDIEKTVLSPLRKTLREFKDDEEKVVIILNSPNVIFNTRKISILETFKTFGAQVVFSADDTCHPDMALKSKYPKIEQGKAYLNSAGFMGYASVLHKLISENLKIHTGDDQLFYTELYLDKDIRRNYDIRVDHTSRLFQTLNDEGEFNIKYRREYAYLFNKACNCTPGVIIGSESSTSLIDIAGDYIARAYSPQYGCLQCNENTINLSQIGEDNFPTVLIGIFIWNPTPFFEEFLGYLNLLDYPKSRLHLFIHLRAKYNQKELEDYVNTYQKQYLSVKYDGLRRHVKEWEAKAEAVSLCVNLSCDYYFNVDSTALLMVPDTLKRLIEQNRGLWTASHVTSAYLVNGTLLQSNHTKPNFYSTDLDADTAFCQHMRKNNVLLYATNRNPWGFLMLSDNYNTSHYHNDLHDIMDNYVPWQMRYLTEDYFKYGDNALKPEQPCQGVYLLRLFTHRFCSELIDELNHYGKWSGAKHEDSRRGPGYDPYPTDDIFLYEAGFSKEWMGVFAHLVMFLRDSLFPRFKDYPEKSGPYVVRYSSDGSAKIQPHKDASSYTTNVALNEKGIDYQGGGVRFISENCSVTELKTGWTLMHLGTKEHESLKVTKGTRYVLVSQRRVYNSSREPNHLIQ